MQLQPIKKTILFATPLLLALQVSGCLRSQSTASKIAPLGLTEQQSLQADAKRFEEPAVPSAVDTAIELSEKYAKLSEEAAVLRQENNHLIAKNKQLKNEAAALDAQLKQTQKELSEATDLMREMLIDLNNWKANVLGFRDEMRQAEKTQLEALLQILQVLGGELKTESDRAEDTSSTTASPNQAGETKNEETFIRSE